MVVKDFCSYVLVSVGPLIVDVGATGAEEADHRAALVVDRVLWQAKGRLRIAGDFVEAPAGGIRASLIQESRREGTVVDDRKGVVHLIVIKKIVGALRSIVTLSCLRHPVDGEGQMVLRSDIRIKSSVVLGCGLTGRT